MSCHGSSGCTGKACARGGRYGARSFTQGSDPAGSSNINLATGATGVTVLGVVTAIHLVEECYTAPSSVSSIGD